jgi:outer membrane protein
MGRSGTRLGCNDRKRSDQVSIGRVLKVRRSSPVRWASGVSLLLLGAPSLAFGQAPAVQSAEKPTPEAAAAAPISSSEFDGTLGVSGGLTAAEAGRRAASTSVDAAFRRESVVSARASREQVIWRAAPRLTFTGQYTRLSEVNLPPNTFGTGAGEETDFPLNNYLLNARLTVPLSDYLLRLAQTLRSAGSNEAAAALDERATRVTAGANAQLAYYDWVRSVLEAILAEQASTQAIAQLNRTQALQSVGRAANADLLQAQAFEADAELALRQAQTQRGIAEERLRVALHARPEEPLRVGEDVLAPFPAADEKLGLEELYAEAVRQRLEIQSLGKGKEALEDVADVEASRALPTLDAFADYTYANPNQRYFIPEAAWHSTWSLGLTLAWTVNDLGTASTQADIVRTQAAQNEHQQNLVREGLRVEVATALGALNQARVSLATAEKGERAAAAAYLAREQLQAQGMATALEVIQAETARIQARLNVINAHIGLRVARVQLDHAVGRDTGVVASQ